MHKDDTKKISADIPKELYAKIMDYACKEEIYKFGPALVQLLTDVFEEEV